ncbi:hypothetical protein E2C01_053465 [Portunus trituberculatus]|uniref:Uncharacterized protein n=1 Tax=Portunus trituberculatus TaxID=210409 RepID=A0A5B7GPI7_PORTR|nr:hypothetical protein [Portunus trituberculatus]
MGEITTSSIPHWTYTHVRDRRLQTLLARQRIGHTYLTQRYLLTRDPQPYRDDYLVPLTVRHLLVESPNSLMRRQMTSAVVAPNTKSSSLLLSTLSGSHELVLGSFRLFQYALLPWMARKIFCQLCPTHGF